MLRISDLLKKSKETKIRQDQPSSEESLLPAALPETVSPPACESLKPVTLVRTAALAASQTAKPERETDQEKPSDIRISSLIAPRPPSGEDTQRLYQEMFFWAEQVYKENGDYASLDIGAMLTRIEKVVEQLQLGNETLLMLAFLKDSADTNYIFSHSVNVCIYSVEMGLGLGFSRLNATELGVLAFLHDTPIAKYISSVYQPIEITIDEQKRLSQYAFVSSQILRSIQDSINTHSPGQSLPEGGLDNPRQSLGLKEEFFSRYSRIIAVADFYEAVTHRGIYGNKRSSLEAVQEILNNKDKFEQDIIKALIDRIGIFPVGSLIRISTREAAQVIKLNRGRPLRPIVKILYDAQGKKLQTEKLLDLSQHPTIYIKEEEKVIEAKSQ